VHEGRVVFGAMNEVVLGRRAAEAVSAQIGGCTSCVMPPFVMRRNCQANAEWQARLAAAMGHPGEHAADVLHDFILGLPRRLRRVGVGPKHFEWISEQAMGTPWIPRLPRPIDVSAQVREILALAA
jgi:maleylacetate reductase